MYDFLIKTTKEAGRAIKAAYRQDFQSGYKGDNPRDEVSEIDRQVNRQIVAAIKGTYPAHGIHSEEMTDTEGNEYIWAIDPIDGTSNFVRGIPHFATCVGLIKGDVVIAGAVYNPITDELFHFKKGDGAYLNDERIHVSDVRDPEDAYVLLHGGRGEENQAWMRNQRKRLYGKVKKIRDFAASALDVCNVAAGKADATLYGRMSPFDVASALGIAREAGAVIYVDGVKDGDILADKRSRLFVLNSEEMYEKLLG